MDAYEDRERFGGCLLPVVAGLLFTVMIFAEEEDSSKSLETTDKVENAIPKKDIDTTGVRKEVIDILKSE